jgi:hypothetical protein
MISNQSIKRTLDQDGTSMLNLYAAICFIGAYQNYSDLKQSNKPENSIVVFDR